MAAWQFDLHLLPVEQAIKVAGVSPTHLHRTMFDSVEWWEHCQPPVEFRGILSRLLDPAPTWSANVELWGIDDCDCVQVSVQDGRVRSIFARIDVRELRSWFLGGIVRLAADWQCLLYTESNKLIKSEIEPLVQEIVRSSAFRFAEDPQRFLNELAKDRGLMSE